MIPQLSVPSVTSHRSAGPTSRGVPWPGARGARGARRPRPRGRGPVAGPVLGRALLPAVALGMLCLAGPTPGGVAPALGATQPAALDATLDAVPPPSAAAEPAAASSTGAGAASGPTATTARPTATVTGPTAVVIRPGATVTGSATATVTGPTATTTAPPTTVTATPSTASSPASVTGSPSASTTGDGTGSTAWVWWVLAAAAVAVAGAGILMVRQRTRRQEWGTAMAAATADVTWLARELIPDLARATTPQQRALAWTGASNRLREVEDRLGRLRVTADDEAGRARAGTLAETVRRVRAQLDQVVTVGGPQDVTDELRAAASELEAALSSARQLA